MLVFLIRKPLKKGGGGATICVIENDVRIFLFENVTVFAIFSSITYSEGYVRI